MIWFVSCSFYRLIFFDMSDPKTAKCEYCSCRYPYKKMGPAYDTVNDRFFTTQCGTCPNIMCYACKFELEDPFDMCTFEIDTCVTCNSKFRTTAKKRNNICINFFFVESFWKMLWACKSTLKKMESQGKLFQERISRGDRPWKFLWMRWKVAWKLKWLKSQLKVQDETLKTPQKKAK